MVYVLLFRRNINIRRPVSVGSLTGHCALYECRLKSEERDEDEKREIRLL